MKKTYTFAFGETQQSIELPDEQVINIVEGNSFEPIADIRAAVEESLHNPIGTPPLAATVKPGEKVVIIASDITRNWIRHDLFLPILLDELNTAGIPDSDIKLIVALGSHRQHSHAENVAAYGQDVVDRIAILESYGLNEDDFAFVGTTSRGTEAYINKEVLAADKVIMTGGIVYHLMAGFGGGRKSIMPGISSYRSIQQNHSFCLSSEIGQGPNEYCYSGNLENNPMHEDILEIARMINPDFLLNAIFTPDGQFARFVAGHWYEAWLSGCKTVEQILGVPISAKADVVIASAGGFPKDINLYQGAKTLDNAAKAVKADGVLIALLECRDIMEPPDFSHWFTYESLYEQELALRKEFTVPGFVALKTAIIAKNNPLIFVTLPQNKDFIEKVGMIAVTSLPEALAKAEEIIKRKDYTITLMGHAANTVPLLK
ncbi:MAG: nickel-dependent lactate racemase [Pelosinus sp.]|nr:nickel-dependent lactate racemase [Pelosinus sp.]